MMEIPPMSNERRAVPMLRAILTDVHLWVPLGVLVAGIGILLYCAQ
jgi:hypothetical protein